MPTVTELHTSRKFAFNEGKPRAEREWVVEGADTEGDVVALFGNLLPQKYDNYPNDAALPVDMLAFDYDISKEPNAVGTWRVVMRFKPEIPATYEPTNPTSQELSPSEVGYRTARLSMRAEFRDKWREYATAAELYLAVRAFDVLVDIGGRSIDIAGIPLSTLHHQQEITILITDQYLPDAQKVANQIGTRNDKPFLAYPAGSVVFAGCNAEIIPEVGRNSIEYRFVFDKEYHLIQYPAASDGRPTLATAAAGGIAKGSALLVYYRQPFPFTTDFSQLSQYFFGL